jgi:uncharacterized membrane protein
MTWLQRYRLHHYLATSLWIPPAASIVLGLAAVPLLHELEIACGWQAAATPDTARLVLGTLAASMFTFIVFVCSALLVAVQLASAQLTPRIIAIVFRDPHTKAALTLFTFSFTFTLAVLVRINGSVPQLTARLAAYGCVASLAVFLYLIDHVGKALRPSGALRATARLGRRVIADVYPRPFDVARTSPREIAGVPSGEPSIVVTNLKDGVVLAVDIRGLVALAQRNNCVIEMAPQVGDFVALGDPLFRLYGAGRVPAAALRQSLAVGQERTLEQDPALPLRIMVDIACKGLSPAINDPTTAVLALDQIHCLLRNIGSRNLDDERVRDATGTVRLIYPTPEWEDFVQLAVTEIRHFGAESIQIARRLRAMLENLIATLPEPRAAVLRQELDLLHRSADRFFLEPEDRALAEISDFQGVGSKGRGRKQSDNSHNDC